MGTGREGKGGRREGEGGREKGSPIPCPSEGEVLLTNTLKYSFLYLLCMTSPRE